MNQPIGGIAPAAPQLDQPKIYLIARDGDRDLQFAGTVVAEVEKAASPRSHRAAVYLTRGGKYISEFSSWSSPGMIDYILQQAGRPPMSQELCARTDLRGKAAVFDSLTEAVKWFRPGPLTAKLLEQLNGAGPEIVE